MSRILKAAAAAALLAGGATIAIAQAPASKVEPGASTQSADTKEAPPGVSAPTPATGPAVSKVEPGAPTQGADLKAGGSRAIGPPADTTKPAPGKNPAGTTVEKQKSEANDPQTGGKKN